MQLLLICRGYRTTSTAALQVLAGIPPLDLQAERESLLARVLRLDENATLWNQNYYHTDYEKHKPVLLGHPADIDLSDSIQLVYASSKKNSFSLYTDGSKTERGADSEQQSSVNLASSLAAIRGNKSRSSYVQELKKILLHCPPSLRPHLVWVPAHVGITGNEKADELAKSAANDKSLREYPVKLPTSYLKRSTLENLLCQWQERWDSAPTGRRTYSFFPKVGTVAKVTNGAQTHFFSGHGPFPTYLKRFHLSGTEFCECGEVGDPDHYLFHCASTKPYHLRRPSDLFWPQWAETICKNSIAKRKLNEVLKYCAQSHAGINRANTSE
ncbi:uncharacterized protein LOC118180053 [Stegodyphus dumicola]|uniref:uncharacterized protein LOC118180053 n=1 Tax=Stegodyphus dumicola TaxID=202533 RepID=UPI0015A8D830|nr:uncharacterized protein LOC118180053 [Stegodyphus dumicola]